jgi:hypothetical protein
MSVVGRLFLTIWAAVLIMAACLATPEPVRVSILGGPGAPAAAGKIALQDTQNPTQTSTHSAAQNASAEQESTQNVALANPAQGPSDPFQTHNPPAASSRGVEVADVPVQFVQALTTINIRNAPSLDAVVVGLALPGDVALTTGRSPDGAWWRISCPDGVLACYVSANPELTQVAVQATPARLLKPGEIQIESASVRILDHVPAQLLVTVQGHLPDGCTFVSDIRQERLGNRFTITLNTVRPPGVACSDALVPFEQNIRLQSIGLASGTYWVQVGDVETLFRLAN